MEHAKTHPILIAAGVAVLLFSLLGIAAITGVLPAANTKPAEFGATPQAADTRVAQAPAAPAAPASRRAPARALAASGCATCGVIESVSAVEVAGEASGIGAVAGGVAGGVVGNQFGHGTGRTLLTIGGAAGGAYAGNAIEKNMKKHTVWKVAVHLDDGSTRTLQLNAQPPFAAGERVRIVNGNALERA
ncbi:MAG TPA: glycine zipper 2TM domain-containing protein [Burkholderiales bacterium]